MRMRMTALLLAGLSPLLSPIIRAQKATGEVNGTVTDSSGGIVPAAAVKLTNQDTGIESTRATNDTGAYPFVNVPPGTYRVRVSKEGFRDAEVTGVVVGVNQAARADVALQLGGVAETVEVTSAAPLIQSTSTELGTVVNQRLVKDLPLNGRNFTQLLLTSPGVTPVSTSQNRSVGCCEGNVGLPNSGFSDPSFHGQQNRSK